MDGSGETKKKNTELIEKSKVIEERYEETMSFMAEKKDRNSVDFEGGGRGGKNGLLCFCCFYLIADNVWVFLQLDDGGKTTPFHVNWIFFFDL